MLAISCYLQINRFRRHGCAFSISQLYTFRIFPLFAVSPLLILVCCQVVYPFLLSTKKKNKKIKTSSKAKRFVLHLYDFELIRDLFCLSSPISITIWAGRLLRASDTNAIQPKLRQHDPAGRHHQVRERAHQNAAGGAIAHSEEDIHKMDELISDQGG